MKFTCIKCGYIKDIIPSDDIEDYGCSLCSGVMINNLDYPSIQKKTEEELLNAVDDWIAEEMKNNIKQLGNDEVFRIIEGFTVVEQRLAYRKYFLKAGGVIPEAEIKEG